MSATALCITNASCVLLPDGSHARTHNCRTCGYAAARCSCPFDLHALQAGLDVTCKSCNGNINLMPGTPNACDRSGDCLIAAVPSFSAISLG